MDAVADKVVVIEDDPGPKRQKLMDYFASLPSTSEPQEFPGILRCFQPTDVLCCVARPKGPVGRPKKSPSTQSTCATDSRPPDVNSEVEKGA